MFGAKFIPRTQYPNERCRWCTTKVIGPQGRYPIPVCASCFEEAYASPKLWERLMTEFEKEAREWVKRQATRPTTLDALATSAEGRQNLEELGKAIGEALANSDHDLVAKLTDEMRQRTEALTQYRTTAPQAIAEIEKEGA